MPQPLTTNSTQERCRANPADPRPVQVDESVNLVNLNLKKMQLALAITEESVTVAGSFGSLFASVTGKISGELGSMMILDLIRGNSIWRGLV